MSCSLYGQDQIFQSIRESFTDLPHIFVTGPPGCGKSTFLKEYIELCKREAPFRVESVFWLSSEKDRGIHTIRDKVNDFCKRAHSKPNSLRFIVIDDADTLPLISQQALRRPMEQFNNLTRFIFASRHSNNLIEPLKSRCLVIELEPISPHDAFPFFVKKEGLEMTPDLNILLNFCLQHFISLSEIKSFIKLYLASKKDNISLEFFLKKIKLLLPVATTYISQLIQSLKIKDIQGIKDNITGLFLNGYLLDDILLGVEKGVYIFPCIDPVSRFTILHFTMLGWISIQQGKEHWLDTMDIVNNVFENTEYLRN
jgi:hypothetical protein